jgi:hypothetical protein
LNIMKKTPFVFAAVACLISALPASAQSPLADAARREAERRQAVRAASPQTYTNDDLAKLPARATLITAPATVVTTVGVAGSSGEPAAGITPKPAGAPAADAAPAGARDEKYWRDRITTARSNLSRAEIFAESLQSRINALSSDLVNRDDPAQRAQLAEQRQVALDELTRVKGEIVAFRTQIADIEDEARRLNVPPGWLR